jgi:hypothetical protein
LFGNHEGAIHKAFTEVKLASFEQVIGYAGQDPLKGAVANPFLEATMDALVGRIAIGKTRSPDPQHAIEQRSISLARSPFAIGSAWRSNDQGGNERPLFIGQIHRCLLPHLSEAVYRF